MDRQSFSIAESEERVQAVIDGALERSTGISSPILLAVDPSGGNLDLQVDAMLAAQRLGWPTISGYSGNVPPGGAQFPTCALAGRQFGAYKWWRRKSHPNAPDPIEDEAALMKRVVFVGADCDDDPLNRRIVPPATDEEPTSEETPSKVTISPVSLRRAGSVIVFTVTIANQSADKWVPGRSSRRVSLSWRFVPDEGMAGDAGWDPREPLPTDIGPGASFVMSGSAALPAKPGDYRLQVSLVADGLFWFHDKGMQVLAFDEVVHVP